MFGNYLINKRKPKINTNPSLQFTKEELNFYVVDVNLLKYISIYDKEEDVLIRNGMQQKKKLREIPYIKICNVLFNQQIFSGVGNIINEALWGVKLQPETTIKNISATKFKSLVKDVVEYSYEFFRIQEKWNAF